MVTGEIYGRPVDMQGGPLALVNYRGEFGTDLMTDAIGAFGDGTPDIAVLLQIAWAMAKTADDAVSPFPKWIREFDSREFTLGDTAGAVGVIDSAISAELFRGRPSRRIRRGLGRRLDSLATRLGRCADGLLHR